MVMLRIPMTDKVIFVGAHDGDVVYNMGDVVEADATITQEDLVVTGNWQDYQSSGTALPGQVRNQGSENELQFDLMASVQGARFSPVNIRGVTASTHRNRNKLVTLEVDPNGK